MTVGISLYIQANGGTFPLPRKLSRELETETPPALHHAPSRRSRGWGSTQSLKLWQTKGAHLLTTTYVQVALYTGIQEGWTVLWVCKGVGECGRAYQKS